MPEKTISFSASRKEALKDYRVFERKLLLASVDLLILFLAYYSALAIQSQRTAELQFTDAFNPEFGIGLVTFLCLGLVFNVYELEYVNKTRKVLPLITFIGGLTLLLTAFFSWTLDFSFSFSGYMILGVLFVLPLSLWRVIYATWIHTIIYTQNVILLSSHRMEEDKLTEVKRSIEGKDYDHGFKVLRSYSIGQGADRQELFGRLKRVSDQGLVNTLVIVEPKEGASIDVISSELMPLLNSGVKIKSFPQLHEEIKEALPLGFSDPKLYSIISDADVKDRYLYEFWHQSLNVFSSLIGLLLCLLIIPLLLLLNPFFNKGPLFYIQKRMGKNGREFDLIKFRSMVEDAEKHGARMSEKNDKRVTPLGKLLRRTRVDELPQFWSVLKGEMNLIGPRPERKYFIQQWSELIPQFEIRHLIKPGITGWAQVKYPYGENKEDSEKKLEYDLYYLKNRSIVLDIRIIYKTIYTMIVSKGQ